jgi:hypothetical protein
MGKLRYATELIIIRRPVTRLSAKSRDHADRRGTGCNQRISMVLCALLAGWVAGLEIVASLMGVIPQQPFLVPAVLVAFVPAFLGAYLGVFIIINRKAGSIASSNQGGHC